MAGRRANESVLNDPPASPGADGVSQRLGSSGCPGRGEEKG